MAQRRGLLREQAAEKLGVAEGTGRKAMATAIRHRATLSGAKVQNLERNS